jgi:ABC-type transport system involved in multi-copper enzyme maturation permease subunit
MNFAQARAVASYTFLESLRTRMFGIIVLFSVMLIASGLLLSTLGSNQQNRILLDFGLGSIEMLGLLAAVFSAVTLVGGEMETKTIYLILTRPVSRGAYLVGRYGGFMASAWSAMGVMAAAHLGVLAIFGPVQTGMYLLAVFFSLLKVAVVGALALLFSLALSSAVTALGFTALLWMLGHFNSEILFIADKTGSLAARIMAHVVVVLVPNLSLLTIRDVWNVPGLPTINLLASGVVYAALYAAVCIGCAVAVFRRREF